MLHLGFVSSAPDLLMTHRSQGNYSARETCPRGPAQGNSRAGEDAGNNKKDRVGLPALVMEWCVLGTEHGGWRVSFYLYRLLLSNFKNTPNPQIKGKNHLPCHHLKLCLPEPLPERTEALIQPLSKFGLSSYIHTYTRLINEAVVYTSGCNLLMSLNNTSRTFLQTVHFHV